MLLTPPRGNSGTSLAYVSVCVCVCVCVCAYMLLTPPRGNSGTPLAFFFKSLFSLLKTKKNRICDFLRFDLSFFCLDTVM
jgi:hypothetical protein